ncbi:acyltransferase family protein [Agromyces salentinus]|uniref:Acyltransferase n=1 Tax=Agromyces salentinus TaxID=269421 RepID=A0ABN2MWD0_9MICO|nr:acyltransferase [Agromyces salentinus]
MLNERNSLNALRLILVLTVILSHSFTLGRYSLSPVFLGHTVGGWALIGLFSVSGYLISSGAIKREYSVFVWSRIARLWPAFVVCILIIATIIAPAGYLIAHGTLDGYLTAENGPIKFLTQNALFEIRQTSISGTPDRFGWTGSLWTVIFTVVSYLIVGAILKIGPDRLRTVIVASCFALSVGLYANVETLIPYLQDPRTIQLLRFLPLFLGGALYFQLRRRLPLRAWAAACAVLLMCLLVFLMPSFGLQLGAPLAAYAILTLANAIRVPAFLRRNDFALGFFYYSFAMQKLIVLSGLGALAGSAWGFFGISVLATLPLAVGSWFLVEKPTLSRRRGTDVPSPALTLPDVAVPALAPPALTVPAVALPAVTVPAVTLPAVTPATPATSENGLSASHPA